MSQRIEGQIPPAVQGAVAVNGRIATAGGDRSAPIEASAGGDSLRLTGEATSLQTIQRELSSASAIDGARVESISAALQAGTYKVDAEAIADRMLDMERELGA